MFRARSSASTSSRPSKRSRRASSPVKSSAAGPSTSVSAPALTAPSSIPRLSSSARYHPYWPPTLLPSRAITVTSDCIPIPDLSPQSAASSDDDIEEAPTPPRVELELAEDDISQFFEDDSDTENLSEIDKSKQESRLSQEPHQTIASNLEQHEDVVMAVVPDDQTQTIPEDHKPVPEVKLSKEQQQVLEEVVDRGRNIFLTGNAGTGKSVLTRAIIKALRKKYDKPLEVAVTATTGVAASNIGGSTVHSWAKIGLGKEDVDTLYYKVRHHAKDETSTWAACKVLIVDEISMLDGKLFDKLEILARRLKKVAQPFGGIQLVLVGDFLQLPPVPDFMAKSDGLRKDLVRFAFQSDSWNRCKLKMVVLTEVFRQKDPEFVKLLNDVRVGKVEGETLRALAKRQKAITYEDGIKAVSLFPTKVRVKDENDKNLRKLVTEAHPYEALDVSCRENHEPYELFYTDPIRLLNFLEKNSQAELKLELKVGAQVMLIKNLQNGLVNGSAGRVVDFFTREDVENSKGKNITGDPIEVAQPILGEKERSRLGLKPNEHYEQLIPPGKWPYVEFTNRTRALLVPMEFASQNSEGVDEAIRTQIPLILAWAISIHKSQGQTLERVRIALAEAFAPGMVYVALSRATNLDAVEVIDFRPNRVKASGIVMDWMKMHEEAAQA